MIVPESQAKGQEDGERKRMQWRFTPLSWGHREEDTPPLVVRACGCLGADTQENTQNEEKKIHGYPLLKLLEDSFPTLVPDLEVFTWSSLFSW